MNLYSIIKNIFGLAGVIYGLNYFFGTGYAVPHYLLMLYLGVMLAISGLVEIKERQRKGFGYFDFILAAILFLALFFVAVTELFAVFF